MSEWKAKRFWKEAKVVAQADGFTVMLDGRPIKTPAKRALVMPTERMARAVADEWQAQPEMIDPRSMPCTRTANAAIDKVGTQHAEVAELLAAYGDSDLLCYRAEGPSTLVEREAQEWDPLLDWAEEILGVRLETRKGIMPVPQKPESLASLAALVHDLTAFELAAFHDLVSLSGSLILGFAAAYDAAPVNRVWEISRLDEIWQAEQWGKDDDAEALSALKQSQFAHAKRMFDLAQPG